MANFQGGFDVRGKYSSFCFLAVATFLASRFKTPTPIFRLGYLSGSPTRDSINLPIRNYLRSFSKVALAGIDPPRKLTNSEN